MPHHNSGGELEYSYTEYERLLACQIRRLKTREPYDLFVGLSTGAWWLLYHMIRCEELFINGFRPWVTFYASRYKKSGPGTMVLSSGLDGNLQGFEKLKRKRRILVLDDLVDAEDGHSTLVKVMLWMPQILCQHKLITRPADVAQVDAAVLLIKEHAFDTLPAKALESVIFAEIVRRDLKTGKCPWVKQPFERSTDNILELVSVPSEKEP